MESMIDFLRFRLFEREDFITLSPVDLQWRFLRRDAIAAGSECQWFCRVRGQPPQDDINSKLED
jgi:hypothetical protein